MPQLSLVWAHFLYEEMWISERGMLCSFSISSEWAFTIFFKAKEKAVETSSAEPLNSGPSRLTRV